ncbi:uncharacterized protein I303_105664 [Kwoniella dejecticola CBS 10117]|uniref:Chitobiosyldiphosphodolichol beta-mannosyltransferase n=1 Tax=Kwoniella dejecticola CBS 10117 TaxID=1296121 RepID=A0A1A6A025_9TREE|nr:beta-1,4-mannosyltransferase [Kwoniella dejecticola CBS 10117]OBR83408.1 beta-1,4-mannosyltransferase [Kwoniella dejecticola CBS 10117]
MDAFQLPGFFPSKPLYNPIEDNPKGVPGHILFPIFMVLITPWTLFFVLLIRRTTLRPSKRNTAVVLVIGDIGRSPRMMYHASSLAKHNIETWIVGYGETTPITKLLEDKHVHILPLDEPPKVLARLPWIARAPIRVIYQIYSIMNLIIWKIPYNTEYLFVQNPPSIPTLAISQFIVLNTGSKLIIDWHNTGYSILSMRLGARSPIVKIARWIEETFGQTAYAHLFVTKALKDYLVKEWELIGRKVVLHDRPPSHFKRTPISEQHDLFSRLLPSLEPPSPPSFLSHSAETTPFTQNTSGQITQRADRPALVVSSTSWTADEDFSLLITALDAYQNSIDSGAVLPRLLVIITGKGGLRAQFENEVSRKQWKDIVVRCVFLPAQDYPLLLGSADLGISLHTSSSGMDLPMKVVDMFGCQLPVLARGFSCIDELVKDGQNGRVFDTGEEMGEQLINVIKEFPQAVELNKLTKYFDAASSKEGSNEWASWDDHWDKTIFNGLMNNAAQ